MIDHQRSVIFFSLCCAQSLLAAVGLSIVGTNKQLRARLKDAINARLVGAPSRDIPSGTFNRYDIR